MSARRKAIVRSIEGILAEPGGVNKRSLERFWGISMTRGQQQIQGKIGKRNESLEASEKRQTRE